MRQKISLWLLKAWDWTIFNNYPTHYKKAILIGTPHTSTLDMPLGFIFYWLGGYPVDKLVERTE